MGCYTFPDESNENERKRDVGLMVFVMSIAKPQLNRAATVMGVDTFK